MLSKRILILGLFLAAGFLFLNNSTASATSYTWTGAGDATTWTDPLNWGQSATRFGGFYPYPGATTTADTITIATQTPGGNITVRATSTPAGTIISLNLGGSGATGGGPTLILGNGAILGASSTVTVMGTSTLKLGDSTWGSGTLLLSNGANNAAPLVIPSTSLTAATGTVTFTGGWDGAGGNTIIVATTTYYNVTFTPTSTATFKAGNGSGSITVSNVLTANSGATLDGNGATLTFSGSGNVGTGSGTFTANNSTVIYSGPSGANISPFTYYNLTLQGSSGTPTYTVVAATAATNAVTIASGNTLAISTYTFTATGSTWTNSGTVTKGTGGKIVHASVSQFDNGGGTAKSSFSGDDRNSVYVRVTDTSLNFLVATAETQTVTITAKSMISDTETVTLIETTVSSGIFSGGVTFGMSGTNVVGQLDYQGPGTLSYAFTDSQDSSDTGTGGTATFTGTAPGGGSSGAAAVTTTTGGGGGGGGGGVAVTTQTTTTTAAPTTPVVTTTPTATAVSTLGSVQSKVTSVIAKIAALPTNPTTSDLASIQAEIAAILIELQSIQAAQPTPQGVALGFNFVRPLALGLRHADVSNLQKALKTDSSVYPEGLVTGYFGPATLRAIQKFQEKYGIASSGKAGYGNVGPATRAKLNALYGSK